MGSTGIQPPPADRRDVPVTATVAAEDDSDVDSVSDTEGDAESLDTDTEQSCGGGSAESMDGTLQHVAAEGAGHMRHMRRKVAPAQVQSPLNKVQHFSDSDDNDSGHDVQGQRDMLGHQVNGHGSGDAQQNGQVKGQIHPSWVKSHQPGSSQVKVTGDHRTAVSFNANQNNGSAEVKFPQDKFEGDDFDDEDEEDRTLDQENTPSPVNTKKLSKARISSGMPHDNHLTPHDNHLTHAYNFEDDEEWEEKMREAPAMTDVQSIPASGGDVKRSAFMKTKGQ